MFSLRNFFWAVSPSKWPHLHEWALVSVYLLVLACFFIYSRSEKYPWLPQINSRQSWDFFNRKRVDNYMNNSCKILEDAEKEYSGQPFRYYTDLGNMLVVPPLYIEEMRGDARLDFMQPVQQDLLSYVPGFEPFQVVPGLTKVITKYLTKTLTKLTQPISQEATIALKSTFGDSPDWQEIKVSESLIRVVSRMSSRVFMGEDLCADDAWNKAAGDYTVAAFNLVGELRRYSKWVLSIIHWFHPSCRDLRRKLDKAREALSPHIERRQMNKKEKLARGEPSPFDDSIEWFENEFQDEYDPAISQITLSVVAIHTTTDLLRQTMIDIARHPELFDALREEAVRVISLDGLKKTSLYNLKLMDSVVKESQRLKPIGLGLFRRKAMADVVLSNGFVVRKGTDVIGNSTTMWSDTSIYGNPREYDGYRFMRMRDTPGKDKMAHLVSTSTNHLGFGHGIHSCPGRFFAANEIKIALLHLVLKYDWKLPEGADPKPIHRGLGLVGDPETTLLVRRRQEEIDLDSWSC